MVRSTGYSEQSEIRHSRLARQFYVVVTAQGGRQCVEQCAKECRSCRLEFGSRNSSLVAPVFRILRSAARSQMGPIKEVSSGRQLGDSIQDDWSLHAHDGFIQIAVQLAGSQPTSGCQPDRASKANLEDGSDCPT